MSSVSPPRRTSYFNGGYAEERYDEAQVTRVAQRIAQANPGIAYRFVWSAACYLARDGQPLNDGRVLEEAKRRLRRYERFAAAAAERLGVNPPKRTAA